MTRSFGGDFGVEGDGPFAPLPVDEHVRNDVLVVVGFDRAAGFRVQGPDQTDHFGQFVVVQRQRFLEPDQVFFREQVDVVADQFDGLGAVRRTLRHLLQLDAQAVSRAFGRDAGWIEVLDAVQNRFDFVLFEVFELRTQPLVYVFQLGVQIAVVVDRIDDRRRNGVIALGERRELHLPAQVFPEALSLAALPHEILVFRLRRAAWRIAVHTIEDVLPGGVDRQLVGDGGLGVEVREFSVAGFGVDDRCLVGPGVADMLFLVGDFQHHVGIQRLLDFLLQFERGHLQQLDGMLQLGGHGQLLPQPELQ